MISAFFLKGSLSFFEAVGIGLDFRLRNGNAMESTDRRISTIRIISRNFIMGIQNGSQPSILHVINLSPQRIKNISGGCVELCFLHE